MSNVDYRFENGIGYGALPGGTTFLFDEELFHRIKDIKWYPCFNKKSGAVYITNRSGETLHQRLMDCPKGYEVDHINLDTMDNRRLNLRILLISKTSAISPCKATTHPAFPASASMHQERSIEHGSKLPNMISTWAIITACTKRCRQGMSVWSACSVNMGSTTTSQTRRHGYRKRSYDSVNALRI